MVRESSQPSVENQQRQAKKPYRKPSVQQYGTLRELTQIAPHSPSFKQDGSGTPAGKNRT
jgi:hypothetical protein